jgi:hypothetical protein
MRAETSIPVNEIIATRRSPRSFNEDIAISTYTDDFPFKFHDYPEDVWGTQMYMLSREHVKKIVEKYTDEYINTMIVENKPFVADFVFTKEGNRALISPILVTEDNKTVYDCEVQETYHRNSFLCHFDKDLFIT